MVPTNILPSAAISISEGVKGSSNPVIFGST